MARPSLKTIVCERSRSQDRRTSAIRSLDRAWEAALSLPSGPQGVETYDTQRFGSYDFQFITDNNDVTVVDPLPAWQHYPQLLLRTPQDFQRFRETLTQAIERMPELAALL